MKKTIVKMGLALFAIAALFIGEMPANTLALEIGNTSLNIGNYDYNQEPIGYGDASWSYEYEMQEYGYEQLVGAYYLGDYFLYLYNENGVIEGMSDVEGNQIVKYIYDDNGIVSEVLSLENGVWIANDNDDFIGNKNKMLSAGFFFDENTNCYYVNERYYNPVLNRYMDGNDDINLFGNENPFYVIEDEGISVLSAEDSDAAASEWANLCLASSSFGTPILNHSSSWYSGLSDVELLARAIYAEGGTAYTDEDSAVAWVIRNRVENANYPSTAAGVVKAAGQFSSITGSKAGNTENARIPATKTERWKHSTYLACFLLTTNSKSEWTTVIGNKINEQLNFYSYTTARQNYANGNCPFSGTTSSTLKYNGKSIGNVYVLGYGNVSSFSSLFSNYSPTAYSRNIYFDYK